MNTSTLQRRCRAKWQRLKANDFKLVKVLRDINGMPLRRVRSNEDGDEIETDEIATAILAHLQRDYDDNWLIFWNLDNKKRTLMRPTVDQFVALLRPTEQAVARRILEDPGVSSASQQE